MLQLLRALGTEREVIWHTGNFLTLVDGQVVVMKRYPLPAPLSLLPSLFTVRALSRRDLASNTRVVLFAMKLSEEDILHLDELVAEAFLKQMGVSQQFIDWFWKSACMTFMNVPLEECSAGALLRIFKQLLGDNRFQFGFPAQGLADLFAPASAAQIIAQGGQILLQRAARSIVQRGDRVSGVILDDGSHIESRFCVCAIPPPSLQRIVPESWLKTSAPFRDLPVFMPVPYVSTYLWFDRKLTGEQMWTRLWAPDNLNYDFYDLSNIRRAWRHRPSVIASNIIHSHRWNGLSDEEVVQATVAELSEFVPHAAEASLLHSRVNRIPLAVLAPHPGTENKRPDTRSPVRGLLLAGDWTNTRFPASMESAVRSGWLAAETIWADEGKPRQLALPMQTAQGLARLVERWATHHRSHI
jgi:15-cis-phytoene desaturase